MKSKPGSALIFLIVTAVLIAGCGNEDKAKIRKLSDLEGKSIGVNAIGISRESYEKVVTANLGVKPRDIVYFNRLSDASAALLAGKVDAVYTLSVVADYYAKRNKNIDVIAAKRNPQFNVVMAVRSDDAKLGKDVNKALAALEQNGTLGRLRKDWITNLPSDNEPGVKQIPKIPGAKTVHVGVCGDLVPMDYVAADGRPAGYNVALLAEIGKLSNINFEFVPLESQAKFAALQSKKIDVIFIHLYVSQVNNNLLADEYTQSKWTLTDPYFQFYGSSFLVKK